MTQLLLITLLVLSNGPVYAEWLVVENNYLPGKQTVYVDPDTIRQEGNLVTMVILIDWKWMQWKGSMINPYRFARLHRFGYAPHGFFSTTTHKQFDCAAKRLRLLAFTEYYGRMATGRAAAGYVDQDNWLPVEPESLNRALWEVACNTQ